MFYLEWNIGVWDLQIIPLFYLHFTHCPKFIKNNNADKNGGLMVAVCR